MEQFHAELTNQISISPPFQAGELLFSVLPAVMGVAGMCVVSGQNRESLIVGGSADGGK
jgi:hypothetical protein